MSDSLYDVIIIGGGPAGLSAAQYAARSHLKTIVIDKSPTAGALAFTRCPKKRSTCWTKPDRASSSNARGGSLTPSLQAW